MVKKLDAIKIYEIAESGNTAGTILLYEGVEVMFLAVHVKGQSRVIVTWYLNIA